VSHTNCAVTTGIALWAINPLVDTGWRLVHFGRKGLTAIAP
jgi:hypothetical protein